ncbi:MAG: TIGR00282 family metallophosphoesterase [Clostridia bacterium]|nr:TIGR00282 family metallophosphoesterase [Clostridia bacterium]
MNVLAIGDIVGDVGCEMFLEHIDGIKKQYEIDFCIVNGENACSNNGITRKKAELLLENGADVLTLGNHTFRQKDAVGLLAGNKRVVRPVNFPEGTVGNGYTVVEKNGKKIAVINALGRIYMDYMDCPFRGIDRVLEKLHADYIFVDFHAEATSEKISMGWYLDGRVTGVFGTHTHVQTADAWVLPKGTGYITDLGMTGPIYSCLGVKREITLERFISCIPRRFEFADGKAQLNGAVFTVGESGKTEKVEAICVK